MWSPSTKPKVFTIRTVHPRNRKRATFEKTSITLVSKLNKDILTEENYRSTSLMNLDEKN